MVLKADIFRYLSCLPRCLEDSEHFTRIRYPSRVAADEPIGHCRLSNNGKLFLSDTDVAQSTRYRQLCEQRLQDYDGLCRFFQLRFNGRQTKTQAFCDPGRAAYSLSRVESH